MGDENDDGAGEDGCEETVREGTRRKRIAVGTTSDGIRATPVSSSTRVKFKLTGDGAGTAAVGIVLLFGNQFMIVAADGS